MIRFFEMDELKIAKCKDSVTSQNKDQIVCKFDN